MTQSTIESVMHLFRTRPDLTYAAIAERIGITRNQAAGIINRNRTAEDAQRTHSKCQYKLAVKRIQRGKPATARVMASNGQWTFADAVEQRRCLYMAADDRKCCGKPLVEGKAWCLEHMAVVYTKAPKTNIDRLAAA